MEIKTNSKGSSAVITPIGKIDTVTAPELQTEIEKVIETAEALEIDFSQINYISSAGLRVLLSTQKKINAKNGTLKITNTDQMIDEIFEVTGFSDILTIVK